jgi:hypothetical protein
VAVLSAQLQAVMAAQAVVVVEQMRHLQQAAQHLHLVRVTTAAQVKALLEAVEAVQVQ